MHAPTDSALARGPVAMTALLVRSGIGMHRSPTICCVALTGRSRSLEVSDRLRAAEKVLPRTQAWSTPACNVDMNVQGFLMIFFQVQGSRPAGPKCFNLQGNVG